MSHSLTHMAIGAGIALSLLSWGIGRVGEVTLATLRPNISTTTAAHTGSLPPFSVHLSIEVRP